MGTKLRGMLVHLLAYACVLILAFGFGAVLCLGESVDPSSTVLVERLDWRAPENAHWLVLAVDVFATFIIFLFSLATDNSSMYDPYWSVIPPVVAVTLANHPGGNAHPVRAALVVGLVCLWALRLTANFFYGWPGLQHEDWRYADFRRQFGPNSLYWFVSFAGIHLFPTLIVWGGMLSLYPALLSGADTPLGWMDVFAFAVTLGSITLEAYADVQLHTFIESNKKASVVVERDDTATVKSTGAILKTGLWSYSRHPNYVGEMGFWVGLWLWSLAANVSLSHELFAWLGLAALLIMFRFASLPLIEERSKKRRSGWEDYCQSVPAFLPVPGWR